MMMKRRRSSARMLLEQQHRYQQQQEQRDHQERQQQQQQQHHESRIVRNIARDVRDYAAGLTRDAKFLNETEVENSVALFHSSEIALGNLLGSGGFSQVYEAKAFNLLQTQPSSAASEMNLTRRIIESTAVDYRGKATYALKHLDKKLLQKPDEFCAAAADLYVEAKYMSRFNHPNILKLRGMANGGTEAFQEGRYNSFFILTDRLADTLDCRIQRWNQQKLQREFHALNHGDMDTSPVMDMHQLIQKANYALQMASALEYLHERRIIFRDLKPQNIGFKGEHQIQLFDFGLCRELPESNGFDPHETFKMSEAGTKRYMAPEIYVRSTYNLKVDCYSWGAVFYEMISLEKPYSRVSDVEFQTFVLGQGLRPNLQPYKLPPSLEQIIQSSWAQNQVQRLSINEIRHSLETLLDSWELEQKQQQEVFASAASATPITPPALRSVLSTSTFGEEIACPPPFGWNNAAASCGMEAPPPLPHVIATHQQQQHQAAVFTFDANLLAPFAGKNHPSQLQNKHKQPLSKHPNSGPLHQGPASYYSGEVTLTTENSTATYQLDHENGGHDDDLSISTFDYSMSSWIHMEDGEEDNHHQNHHHHRHQHRDHAITTDLPGIFPAATASYTCL